MKTIFKAFVVCFVLMAGLPAEARTVEECKQLWTKAFQVEGHCIPLCKMDNHNTACTPEQLSQYQSKCDQITDRNIKEEWAACERDPDGEDN